MNHIETTSPAGNQKHLFVINGLNRLSTETVELNGKPTKGFIAKLNQIDKQRSRWHDCITIYRDQIPLEVAAEHQAYIVSHYGADYRDSTPDVFDGILDEIQWLQEEYLQDHREAA